MAFFNTHSGCGETMPKMKIDAISVTSSNMMATVKFYESLGFSFPKFGPGEDHLEPKTEEGEVRLMIDKKDLIHSILGREPKPPTHSAFAIKCGSAKEVDAAFGKVKAAGGKAVKEPWDAFWGQRYAIVADPDGYMIDLFAWL